MARLPDPRPLVGEPLALDLLNTEWIFEGQPVDYFAERGNLAHWLHATGLGGAPSDAVYDALVESRAAIRAVLTDGDERARRRLNRVLAHGAIRLALDADATVVRDYEVDDPSWRPAALAARDLLELLDHVPGRIRRCEHPKCVLWFLDTSRNGKRRWHSMATCGNREKARRHYDLTRG